MKKNFLFQRDNSNICTVKHITNFLKVKKIKVLS